MSSHPALRLSEARRKVWLEKAEPEDFFDMIAELSRLYRKKAVALGKQNQHGDLVDDYKKYNMATAKRVTSNG